MSAINSPSWKPVTIIVILMIAIISPTPDDPGIWFETLFNWLHVPLFGLISLALLSLVPANWNDTRRFGFAFAGSLILAGASEAVQIPLPRDADWQDVVADSIGALSFLLFARISRRKILVSIMFIFAGMTLLLISALPVISLTKAIISRNEQFPVIFDGAVDVQSQFVRERSVRLSSCQSSDQAPGCTRVELLHGRWPGLTIDHVYPDWRSYSKLIFDLEVEGDRPIIVTIRVHDRQHARGDELYDDRYNREFRLEPGRNIIEIRIDEITTSPTDRTMDGNAIKSLAIFSTDDFAGLAFRLYEIRLN